jgi:transposase, IS6 family
MLLAPSVSSLFKWRQFEPEVILLAVGWYLRFSLSYRDVEELPAERGLLVDPSPSGGGFNAPELNRRVRKRQSRKTVALGRIEVAFYAMTQKICTYCDEPATTVGHDYRAGAQ